MYELSQWEEVLLCNAFSHWPNLYSEMILDQTYPFYQEINLFKSAGSNELCSTKMYQPELSNILKPLHE